MPTLFAWSIIVLIAGIGLSACRKLIGIGLGESLLHRWRAEQIHVEAACAQMVDLRLRYGRFDFRWLGAISSGAGIISFVALLIRGHDIDLGPTLRELIDAIPALEGRILDNLLGLVTPLLFIAIPLVEFLDRRQSRIFPDPDNPLEAKRPPFGNGTLAVWWITVALAPLWLNLDLRQPGPGVVALASLGGFALTWPIVWLLERLARHFPMDSEGAAGSRILGRARSLGIPVVNVIVVSDERVSMRRVLWTIYVSSGLFERFTAEERDRILTYELVRSHPKFLRLYGGFACFLVVLLGALIALSAGPLLGFGLLFGCAALGIGLIERVRMSAAVREIGLAEFEMGAVAQYMELKPSLLNP